MLTKKTAPSKPEGLTARIARRGGLYSVEVQVSAVWVPVEQSESLGRAQQLLAGLRAPVEDVFDA